MGYASALVAHVSQYVLAQGVKRCFLYTDMGNATTNRIYPAVGYRKICEVVDVDFT